MVYYYGLLRRAVSALLAMTFLGCIYVIARPHSGRGNPIVGTMGLDFRRC